MTTSPPTADALVRRILETEDAEQRRALIHAHTLDPTALHDAVMRMDAEAERLLGADPRRAEQLCRTMLVLAEHAEETYLIAVAHRRLADALRSRGRNVEARDESDIAAAIFTDLGLAVDAARTRIAWSLATANLGKLDEALAAVRRARPVLLAHGELLRVANLDQNTGFLLAEHGLYARALRHFTAALNHYRLLGEQALPRVARSHANRGLALSRMGRHREAITESQLALALFQRLGARADTAHAHRSIGENLMALGRYSAALRSLAEAAPLYRSLERHDGVVFIANATAECYLLLNRPFDALAVLAEAEPYLREIDLPAHSLAAVSRRVAALLRLGEHDQALTVLDAVRDTAAAGPVSHRGWLALQRAIALLGEEQAHDALVAAAEASTLARASGMRRIAGDAAVVRGAALLKLDQVDQAARAAASARRTARTLGVAPLLARTYELLGQVAEAKGKPYAARRHYAAAIQHLEREAQGVIFEFRDSFGATRAGAFERLAALQLDAGDAVGALTTAERAKSRALADALAGGIDVLPRRRGRATTRRLQAQLAEVREDYAATVARLRRADREDDPAGIDSLAALESRIATLIQQIQIAGADDDPAGRYGAPLVRLPEVPDGTALIEFFASGDDLLRIVVDQEGVHGTRLPGAARASDALVISFRLNVEAAEHARTAGGTLEHLARQARLLLTRLHTLLLGDLDGQAAYQSLVVVPHGSLHYIPFHALHDGEHFLVERTSVTYAPSATIYGMCRARAGDRRQRRALVLAHDAGGALPYAGVEAAAVGQVLRAPVHEGAAASRELLTRGGRRAGLIHIAAHGRFRPDAPLFSYVELADGPLTTAEILNLKLSADLVTLSACETGRAVLGGGDELAGLSRAFLYAGANALLVSQWRVDDATTSDLMTRFYTELAAGCGRAAALQTAQRAFIERYDGDGEHVHPFFWAGFQLIGDGDGARRPSRARERREQ